MPNPIVQAVGRGLNMLAPSMPMIHIVTGLVSDHPDVDAEFYGTFPKPLAELQYSLTWLPFLCSRPPNVL